MKKTGNTNLLDEYPGAVVAMSETPTPRRDSDLSMSAGSVPKCPNCNGRGWVESHLLGGSKVWCGMRKCEARDAEIQSQNH